MSSADGYSLQSRPPRPRLREGGSESSVEARPKISPNELGSPSISGLNSRPQGKPMKLRVRMRTTPRLPVSRRSTNRPELAARVVAELARYVLDTPCAYRQQE